MEIVSGGGTSIALSFGNWIIKGTSVFITYSVDKLTYIHSEIAKNNAPKTLFDEKNLNIFLNYIYLYNFLNKTLK